MSGVREAGSGKREAALRDGGRGTRDALTGPVEDYLKAIYAIGKGSGAAATNEIAQRLDLTPASVSGMVRRLADQGLLAYERYHGVKLTESGRRAALRTLRRHRVIEAYLAEALGYPWDRVHDEAERLEHAASDELVDRMAATIGEPEVDPHGAPIPTRDGAVDETVYRSLAELQVGSAGVVVRVSDEDPEMLRYLAELSILPGKRVTVKARAPFDGPITLSIARQELSIGPALAAQVMVAPIADRAVKRG
ncbi:MAG TPA: metal-dependent transcriptional regulator [Gemmatimonadaceae bacterium]|nr:metal-dependent transcriptional regulator [Gemmatimonadaceae bacterium]